MADEEEPSTPTEWAAYAFVAGVVFIVVVVSYILWEL